MRRIPVRSQIRTDEGKKLCLVCRNSLPPRRSSYCSDECYIRNTPQMIRALVERRDKGICFGCKTQCRARCDPLRWQDSNAWHKLPRWEADHIVPVIEGGGLCGVDGYRTMCLACHKSETKALAARRAERRRNEKANPAKGDTNE